MIGLVDGFMVALLIDHYTKRDEHKEHCFLMDMEAKVEGDQISEREEFAEVMSVDLANHDDYDRLRERC